MFRYRREVPPEYEPMGLNFGGVFSPRSWRRFVEALPSALRDDGRAEDESPEAIEATEAAIRAVQERP